MSTEKNSLTHRLIHWVLALAMSVLFLTGFLRMVWMSKKAIASAVNGATSEVALTKEQLSSIVKEIREPMWEWHEMFAYVAIAAFSARILYMLFKGVCFPNPFSSQFNVRERMQGSLYILFYLFVAVNVVTGLCLSFDIGGSAKDVMEDIHKLAIFWFPAFIVMHFVGIFLAELGKEKGVASRMIGGV